MNDAPKVSPLKTALKNKFAGVQLSEAQLEQLKHIEQSSDTGNATVPLETPEKALEKFSIPEKNSDRATSKRPLAFGWAASIAGMLIAGWVLVSIIRAITPAQDLLAAITQEVRTNHIYDKPLDYVSGDAKTLLTQFDRLDFEPLLVSLPNSSWALMGGRYCTLQGQIALLVRFQDADGNALTYYLTKHTDTFAKVPDSAHPYLETESGLTVRLWQQAGLVAAIVHQAESHHL